MKVVLAYSGGLDTSVCIKWLQEEYKADVITFTADLGQGDLHIEDLKSRALIIGASQVYINDVKEEFARDYVLPTLQAGAAYEGKYLLATALSRPLIATKLVEIAHREKADAVAHGCTGKGNDQVRFEVTVMALDPKLKVIAPLREWTMKSREGEIEYAKAHNIPITSTKAKPYSYDRNLWHLSAEAGVLEDPWVEPPEDVYQLTVSPEKAPDNPTYIEIEFERGVPKKLDGEDIPLVPLIEKLNELGGKNGIGRVDMVENRLVGIKSREIYECPAATILYTAHQALETLTLDRGTMHFKQEVAGRYAELVYYGLWYSPLKKALDEFVKVTQQNITGTIRLKLYKGNCLVVGRKSPLSLYDYSLATYDEADIFDHRSAKGFIQLWGLPLKVASSIGK